MSKHEYKGVLKALRKDKKSGLLEMRAEKKPVVKPRKKITTETGYIKRFA